MRAHGAPILVVFVASLASPVAAADWGLRFTGGAIEYSRQSVSGSSLGTTELTLDGGFALSLAGEVRLGEVAGLELSIATIALDATATEYEIRGVGDPPRPVAVAVDSDSGDLTARPLAAAVLFRPFGLARSDLYFGPEIAWVDYDVGLDGPPERDAEWAFGARIGWEWRPAASRWSIGLAYRYLDVQHEGGERDLYTGLFLHILSLAVSHRFGESENRR